MGWNHQPDQAYSNAKVSSRVGEYFRAGKHEKLCSNCSQCNKRLGLRRNAIAKSTKVGFSSICLFRENGSIFSIFQSSGPLGLETSGPLGLGSTPFPQWQWQWAVFTVYMGHGCWTKNRGIFFPPKWMVNIMVQNPMNTWMIWGFSHIFENAHIYIYDIYIYIEGFPAKNEIILVVIC